MVCSFGISVFGFSDFPSDPSVRETFRCRRCRRGGKIGLMNAAAIKEVAERQPFRPFAVRLNNGTQYTFSEPRNFGAPKDFREIFYFGDSEWVLIDLESITEIIRR